MLHPRSLGKRIGSIVGRRQPTATTALIVALLALFLAAGGVGWAATSLPSNSVGTNQIRNFAVTNAKLANLAVGNRKLAAEAVGFRKIIPGTVGAVRVNRDAVQLRVSGTCPAAGGTATGGQTTTTPGPQAITAVQNNGRVTCAQTSPAAFTGGQPLSAGAPTSVAVPDATSAQVMAFQLPAHSSYVVLANPQIEVNVAPTATGTGADGHVEVGCELSVTPAGTASTTGTQNRTTSFDVGGFGGSASESPPDVQASLQQSATLPLEVSVPASTSALNVVVTCSRVLGGNLTAATTTVTAQGTITAISTSSNTALPSTIPAAP